MVRLEPKPRMAVDLTPVRPGGANGGAKLLVMALLDHLWRFWDITCFCQPDMLPEMLRRFGARLDAVSVSPCDHLAARYDAQCAAKGPFAVNFFPMQRVSIHGTDTPTVSVVHDLQFADMPQNFTPTELAERAASFRSCIDHSDVIVTVSRFSKARIEAIGQIDGSRIRVIYNALDPEPAEGGPDAAAPLPANPYFLYPANFWPHKNHRRLLEAYRKYRNTCSQPLDLVLTGDSGAAGSDLVAALRNEPGIHVAGFLERKALQALMDRAFALVFPSLYEGFGMPLSEAMAVGIPITCSDAGSLPEVAGSAALLFDGNDVGAIAAALARIADDGTLRAELVVAGQARLSELGGASRMGEAYREAFAAAIAARPVPYLEITGVDQDGWAGPAARIDRPFADRAAQLALRLSLPDWVPLARQVVEICTEERLIAQRTLWPGQDKTIAITLAPGESFVRIDARETFLASDVMEHRPAPHRAFKLEAASCSAKDHGYAAWPLPGAKALADPAVLLLVVDHNADDGVVLTATCASQQPSTIRFIRECSESPPHIEVQVQPLRHEPHNAEASRIVLPVSHEAAPLVSSGSVPRETFHANALTPPAVIPRCDTRPGFSVIIPSFNQGRFIARTIDSALQQDHVCEVLVIDGGSSDETLDVLASYGPRIRWSSGKDAGQADAVNIGLQRAVGEHIAWINSDDTYAAGAFDRVLRIFADRKDIGVVYGDADHIDEDDRFIDSYPTMDFDAAELLDWCFICQPAAFFRRQVAVEQGGLRPSLRYCLDYEFWIRLAAAGVTFERTPQLLAHSRMYAANKTMGETLHAYFETADVLVRGAGYRAGPWQERFAAIAADWIVRVHPIPRAAALQAARQLSSAIWT